MLPIPNAVTEVNAANKIASHFLFIPRSSTYIGPPAIEPSGIFTLYLTARRASTYFVAIPNTPVSHIHKTAPSPPDASAVASPTIIHVPIVATIPDIKDPHRHIFTI